MSNGGGSGAQFVGGAGCYTTGCQQVEFTVNALFAEQVCAGIAGLRPHLLNQEEHRYYYLKDEFVEK